ncbi:hypothetical protein ACLOJK_011187 [Asimina triloba]
MCQCEKDGHLGGWYFGRWNPKAIDLLDKAPQLQHSHDSSGIEENRVPDDKVVDVTSSIRKWRGKMEEDGRILEFKIQLGTQVYHATTQGGVHFTGCTRHQTTKKPYTHAHGRCVI